MKQVTLMQCMLNAPVLERIKRIIRGLKAPKDSGDYKYARYALTRIFAPSTVTMVVMIILLLMAFWIRMDPVSNIEQPAIVTEYVDPDLPKETPKIEKDDVDTKRPDPEMDAILADADKFSPFNDGTIDLKDPVIQDYAPGEDPSDPKIGVNGITDSPFIPNDVILTKSPVGINKLRANTGRGDRQQLLRQHAPQTRKDVFPTEDAVYMALRWLKTRQNTDGSWPTTKPAMTGLALLTFLAHGDDLQSKEFGATIEMGLRWLIDNQLENGRFRESDGHEYSLPIAAYALCEGYAMTGHPDVKSAAEKAIYLIVENQHASGGWNYNLNKEDRDDTSYMGWCAQALKAAKMAKLDVANLDEAIKKTVNGFKKNYAGNYDLGGFGYTAPQQSGLTSVGVLCMQFMGAGKSDEVKGGLAYLNGENYKTYDLDDPKPGPQSLYYWYYATQAKFQAGGDSWNSWNRIFSAELVKKQHILKKEESGYLDQNGRPQAIGWWDQYKGHGAQEGSNIFTTVLCTLQLEVYYRYLPTYKIDADNDVTAQNKKNDPVDKTDQKLSLNIQI